MQEDVRQQGRDRRALRAPAIPRLQGAVLALQRRLKPPLHVEEDPPLAGVTGERAQDERVVERVEERPQIEIDHPVVSPTPLPTHPHRVQGRASRPVPVGVRVEHGLHLRLQVQVHDRLRDPVGDRGHAEHPRPAAAFRDLDRPHRRRHVAPRAKPIPELVEVPRQVRLERLDRLLVDTRSPPVGLHPQPRLPDQPLRNRKRLAVRLRLAHRLLPRASRLTDQQARMTRPLRSARITGPHRYYEAVRPCAPHRYSAPHGFRRLGCSLPRTTAGRCCTTGRPRARDDRFPRSTPKPRPSSRHLHAGHHLASQQAPARLIPGPHAAPGFDVTHMFSTRPQWFASARLPGPHLTRSQARLLRDAQHPGS